MNHGFVKPRVIEEKEYILGASVLPQEVIRPDGQWDDFLPKDEFQRSEDFDTSNCTAYGTENCYETLIKAKYGEELDFSERDLGIRAGTRPPGNDPNTVAETARTKGLIHDSMLPFDVRTVDEYYSYPNETKQKECDTSATLFLSRHKLGHEWVFKPSKISLEEQRTAMKEALMYSPLGLAVYAWSEQNGIYYRGGDDGHWVMVYGYYDNGDWKCFDSYNYSKKRLDKDFGFMFVKRFHIEKLKEPEKKLTFWGMIMSFINKLFSSDYRRFGKVRSPDWNKTRKTHLKNNPTCAITGSDRDCEVHHRKPFYKYPELENDPNNLITLRRDAHLLFGHLGKWTAINKDIDEDIITWHNKIKNR